MNTADITTDPLFNRSISDMPETTVAKVSFTAPCRFVFDNPATLESIEVEIPTAEVFESGDWISRRAAGVKLSKVISWLRTNGFHRVGFEMRVSIA
jgi:hypothetical protein